MTLLFLALLATVGKDDGAVAPVRAVSANGRYRVAISTPGSIAINTWHEWDLKIERPDGAPFRLHALAVDGGMPAHGHGLPTTPAVLPTATAGTYVVTGLRFNMPGAWTLRVLTLDDDGGDAATLSLVVGPAGTTGPTADLKWNESERATLRSLRLDPAAVPPPDSTNQVADDARAVDFGHQLFFDARLSSDGQTSCATCHIPEKYFAGGQRQGHPGVATVRDVPTVVGVAFSRWFTWDGRRDSLWAQALGPLESAAEMNTTRLRAVRYVSSRPRYRKAYTTLFGPLPVLDGLPQDASPVGDARQQAAWSKIPPHRQIAINRVFSRLGKAIESYERRLLPGVSPFDRYVDAVLADDAFAAARALSPRAERGLKIFISETAQCLRCHNGPFFTNGGFHNIGTATLDGEHPDFGRSMGVQAVLSDEFNCLGPYNDQSVRECPELRFLNRHDDNGRLVGAYKVPSLRHAAQTAPYMHDGRYRSLIDVMEHYRAPPSGSPEFQPIFDYTPDHLSALTAFVTSLSGPIAAPSALLNRP